VSSYSSFLYLNQSISLASTNSQYLKTWNEFCAGIADINGDNYVDMGVDVCFGDSGGPMITDNNGVATLVGVVRRGEGCAVHPGIYTPVAFFYPWIKYVTDGGDPELCTADSCPGSDDPATPPPVVVTDPPIDVTDPPVDVTDPPVDVTDPPVDVTDPPVTTIDVDMTLEELTNTLVGMIPPISCYNKKGVLDETKSAKRASQIEAKINAFCNYFNKFTYDTSSIGCVDKNQAEAKFSIDDVNEANYDKILEQLLDHVAAVSQDCKNTNKYQKQSKNKYKAVLKMINKVVNWNCMEDEYLQELP
jgi:hypothetical protein